MDFQSAMETFAEAWVAANAHQRPSEHGFSTQNEPLELTTGRDRTGEESNAASTPRYPPSSSPYAEDGPSTSSGAYMSLPSCSRDQDCGSSLQKLRPGRQWNRRKNMKPFKISPVQEVDQVQEQGQPKPPIYTALSNLKNGGWSPNQDDVMDLSSLKGIDLSAPEFFKIPNSSFDRVKEVQMNCLVESIFSVSHEGDGHCEMDTVITIQPFTPVQDLVSVALSQLGYAKELAAAARGTIKIKNWRPLPISSISSARSSVGEIFGALTGLVTLRIQIFRSQADRLTAVKDRLLKLMLAQHHQLLGASGCPIDENMMSALLRGNNFGPDLITEEAMVKLEAWLAMQQMNMGRALPPWYPAPPPQIPKPEPAIPAPLPQQVAPRAAPTQTPRARTSFDPELELPRLQQWFSENQHPSRQQIQLYVKELNSLECRRGRRLLQANNVVYWFKNARAALKKDYKNLSHGSGALETKYLWNGYHSNSQSPSEGAAGISPGSLNQDSGESPQTSPLPDKESPPPPSSNANNGGCGDVDEPAATQTQLDDIDPDNNNKHDPPKETDREKAMSQEDEEPLEDEEGRVEGSSSMDPRGHNFPMIQNSMFSSVLNMYYYRSLPQQVGIPAMVDDRRKRNRTFIDPQTEVPRLEQWFSINTHPPHSLIVKYTDDLNKMDYRKKFPRLEPKNVQFWFKNRRAKCKRLKMALNDYGGNSYYPSHIPSSISGESYPAVP